MALCWKRHLCDAPCIGYFIIVMLKWLCCEVRGCCILRCFPVPRTFLVIMLLSLSMCDVSHSPAQVSSEQPFPTWTGRPRRSTMWWSKPRTWGDTWVDSQAQPKWRSHWLMSMTTRPSFHRVSTGLGFHFSTVPQPVVSSVPFLLSPLPRRKIWKNRGSYDHFCHKWKQKQLNSINNNKNVRWSRGSRSKKRHEKFHDTGNRKSILWS